MKTKGLRHYGGKFFLPHTPGETTWEVVLAEGETAIMPGTTKWWYRGPGKLIYTLHYDGGMDATNDGCVMIPSDTSGR